MGGYDPSEESIDTLSERLGDLEFQYDHFQEMIFKFLLTITDSWFMISRDPAVNEWFKSYKPRHIKQLVCEIERLQNNTRHYEDQILKNQQQINSLAEVIKKLELDIQE